MVAGVVFTWLGMVLAISFLEAPLKFRAPKVTVRIGLGIGRIVFRALNAVEVVLAVVLVAALVFGDVAAGVLVAALAVVVVLVVRLAAVRPALNRRSDRVLAGETLPRSRAHLVYIATEVVKVAAHWSPRVCWRYDPRRAGVYRTASRARATAATSRPKSRSATS